MNTDRPLRIGISACLLGKEVRHDGGHKRDAFLVETLGPLVEWVPVCPEVDLGLGTPREAIRLVRDPRELDGVRLSTVRSGVNLTKHMQRYARRRVRALANEGLSGYILKKGSPSCGMGRVKVWTSKGGVADRRGRGLLLRQESGPAPPAGSQLLGAIALTWRASVSAEKTVRPWLQVSTSSMTGDQADPVFGARPSPWRQSGEARQRLQDARRLTDVNPRQGTKSTMAHHRPRPSRVAR